MKYNVTKYIVADSNNEIVYVGVGNTCRMLAEELNKGEKTIFGHSKPYSWDLVKGSLESVNKLD